MLEGQLMQMPFHPYQHVYLLASGIYNVENRWCPKGSFQLPVRPKRDASHLHEALAYHVLVLQCFGVCFIKKEIGTHLV